MPQSQGFAAAATRYASTGELLPEAGMTLRDYLAARAPSWWMSRKPQTVAQAKIAMANRGIITREAANRYEYQLSPYQWDLLHCRMAYEYADAMLAARTTHQEKD